MIEAIADRFVCPRAVSPRLGPSLAAFAGLLLAAAPGWTQTTEPERGPLSPEAELATFQLADGGLVVELVAAEPDIVSPVAMAWGANGELYVAEMSDYPVGPASGRVRLLRDPDPSGRYRQISVLADQLKFPNGVLPWQGGVLVTAAPDIWFFKDTDGDGRADERRVVLTGFGEGNQQLRVNGLLWGLDNWVYGANGRSEGEVRRPDEPPAKAVSIRGHDFRFRPGTLEFERTAGRSQFGLTRDDWGDRFLSWNTIPIRHEVLPERYLTRNRYLGATESLLDCFPPDDSMRVFQVSPRVKAFNNEPAGFFNASCGLAVYRGDALPVEYRGNAFVAEPLRNLVHRRGLLAAGLSFQAQRLEQDREFLAGADPWFHPVNFATGPDGALYIADFYRKWVEHPDFVHDNWRNKVNWRTGSGHGRIWRVRAKAAPLKPPAAESVPARLAGPDLVKHLAHANGWWRDTAQRLLLERGDKSILPLLRDTALDRAADRPLARAAALWTLGGLGGLDEPTLLRALRDLDPRVREQAVKLAEPRLRQAPDLAQTILAMALTEDGRPGFQVLLTLGELRGFAKTAAMVTLLRHVALDRWYSWAALSGLEDEGLAFLQDLVTLDAAWLEEPTEAQAWFLDQLGRLFGARHLDEEMAGLWQVLGGRAAAPGAVSLLAGLSSEFAAHRTPLRQWLAQPPTALASAPQTAERILDRAAALAGAAEATLTLRIQAVRLLAQGAPALAAQRLPALLGPGHPGELRAAAAQALLDSSDPEAAKAVFAGWRQHPTALRRRLLGAASRSAAAAAALLDALEQGRLELSEVDLPSRQALQQHGQPLVRDRAARLLREAAASDRAQVVNSYAPALQLAGDRQRGAATFARNCLVCHSVQSFGGHVGPDLSGIGERPKETLLTDVLDPSRQVSSDFLNYSVETSAGDSESGLIVAETPVSITLRRANAPDLTLLRSQVLELRAGGKSVMPDGFEQVLDHQGMADLLGFLQQPDKDLLPVEK